MNTFQVVALALIGFFLALNMGALLRGQGKGRSLAWCLVWTIAAASVLRPDFPNALANAIGIGRGADLVLYVFALACLAGFFWLGRRDLNRERGLTLLVRHLALRDAFDQCAMHDLSGNGASGESARESGGQTE